MLTGFLLGNIVLSLYYYVYMIFIHYLFQHYWQICNAKLFDKNASTSKQETTHVTFYPRLPAVGRTFPTSR